MDKGNAKGSADFEPPKYLTSLIAAINDGAKAAQGGALAFLLVGVYLLATAFSSSDEDLLRGKTVTISQIGASLPVTFSFAIAPLVFVFVHLYTLARYDMLAVNARHFVSKLRRGVWWDAHREDCRQLLANVEFLAALTAPRDSGLYSRLWPWLFRGMVVVFPVTVLLLVQVNALRYQSDLIMWVQRATLAVDLAALTWFFRRNSLDGSEWPDRRLASARRWAGLLWWPAVVLTLNFLYLNVVPADADVKFVRYSSALDREHFPIMSNPLDTLVCPRLNWGCRYLRVDRRTLVDHVWESKVMADLRAPGAELAKVLAGIEGLVLRDRSFRFAVLDASRLYAADLVGADLRGASLQRTNLLGATLSTTKLQGADLAYAQLQRANLKSADLQGANLSNADLRGADLAYAKMQDATLVGAKLQKGANLFSAELRDANLSLAELQGADLSNADMRGARLFRAKLSGADLRGTKLQGADLSNADMRGAELGLAHLQGAGLGAAELQGANLLIAELQGADLRGAHLQVANLHKAHLQGADLSNADLRGADLSRADLQAANLKQTRLGQVHFTDPANFTLADVRGADFHTGLTDEERAFLRQILDAVGPGGNAAPPNDAVPDDSAVLREVIASNRILEAEKRLERALPADELLRGFRLRGQPREASVGFHAYRASTCQAP